MVFNFKFLVLFSLLLFCHITRLAAYHAVPHRTSWNNITIIQSLMYAYFFLFLQTKTRKSKLSLSLSILLYNVSRETLILYSNVSRETSTKTR